MPKKSTDIDPQKRAHQKHDEMRKDLPRLPGTRLINEEDAETMDKLYSRFSNKYQAILEAAKFWLEKNKEKEKKK